MLLRASTSCLLFRQIPSLVAAVPGAPLLLPSKICSSTLQQRGVYFGGKVCQQCRFNGQRRALAVRSDMASNDKIQLYSLSTPNGRKVAVALEEMGIPYDAHKIDIMKDDQFKPEFLAINPNNKIPAIVDPNGPAGKPFNVFESGAILLYLADKSGKFISKDPSLKWETVQWLMFQMGGVGPMFGQFGHFHVYALEKCDHQYPKDRYKNETLRLLGVLEKRLDARDYLIDDGYSIADMATFPWVVCLDTGYKKGEFLELNAKFPKVMAWVKRCMDRPAVQRAWNVTSMS